MYNKVWVENWIACCQAFYNDSHLCKVSLVQQKMVQGSHSLFDFLSILLFKTML